MKLDARFLKRESCLIKIQRGLKIHSSHLMTIFAQDVHEKVLVLFGHRRDDHLVIEIIPQLLHVQHGLLTSWACIVARTKKLLKAGPMQEMAARGYVTRNSTRMNIF
jgi:hypothetical protein